MIGLDGGEIGSWISGFLLPLFRIASLLMVMPVIGTQMVPARVRLYMALAITLALAPVLPPMPLVEALSLKAIVLIGEQILIGALLGFALQLDRKSTRLNSSHVRISYAVFCLKK